MREPRRRPARRVCQLGLGSGIGGVLAALRSLDASVACLVDDRADAAAALALSILAGAA